jgi:hypothetical protein
MRRGLILAAAVLLACAAFGIWMLRGAGEGQQLESGRPGMPEEVGTLALAAPPLRASPTAAAAESPSKYRVRVVDEEAGSAIVSAVVDLAEIPAGWDGNPGWAIARVLSTCETDSRGTCSFQLRSDKGGATRHYAVASAPDFVEQWEAFAPSPNDHGEVLTVRLARATTLQGTVQTASGTPVADGLLIAESVRDTIAPGLDAGHGPPPGRRPRVTRADRGGRFSIPGVSAAQYYRVRPLEDGWAILHEMGPAGPAPPAVYRGGTTGIALTLHLVRGFAIRCVDAATGQPVPRTIGASALVMSGTRVRPIDSARSSPFGIGTGETRPPVPRLRDPGAYLEGLVSGYFVLDGEPPPEGATVSVLLQCMGYEDELAKVPALLPSQVENGQPTEVRLERSDAARGTGTLVVRESRPETPYWRPSQRVVAIEGNPSDGGCVIWGRRSGAEWEFLGVPVGKHRVRLFDGIETSEPVDVEIVPHAVTRVAASFPESTGIVIVMRDTEGTRLYDAEMVIPVIQDGRKSGVVNPDRYTTSHVDPESGKPIEVVCPQRPGEYVVRIKKLGYEWASQRVQVVTGQVAAVELTLTPEAVR